MANGKIVEYVRKNAGNHLKLVGYNRIFLCHLPSTFQLADAAEGLKYLHNANIVHGNLKGVSLSSGFHGHLSCCVGQPPGHECRPRHSMPRGLRVHDIRARPMSRNGVVGVHSEWRVRFFHGTRTSRPIKVRTEQVHAFEGSRHLRDSDGYLPGTYHVILIPNTCLPIRPVQVLTGTLPFGKPSGSEVVFKVLGGETPSKPTNASKLGLSENVWKLLEDCWQTQRALRPSVKDVSDRVKAAASICGTVLSVEGVPQRHEDSESDSTEFGRPLSHSLSDMEFSGFYRSIVP